MANTTLHPESAAITTGIDPALYEAAAAMMGLPSNHPDVIARVKHEHDECLGLEYAANATRAAMDALSALNAIEIGQLLDRHAEGYRAEHLAGYGLLRVARRRLREAVGEGSNPAGYDRFMDMLSAQGIDIYDD